MKKGRLLSTFVSLCFLSILLSCNNGINYPVVEISQGLKDVVNNGVYRTYDSFHHGLAIVMNSSEQYGLIDVNGQEVVPCKFQSLEYKDGFYKYTYERYREYSYDRKWGVLDSLGRDFIPQEYLEMNLWPTMRLIQMKIDSNLYHFYTYEGKMCSPFDALDDNIGIADDIFFTKVWRSKSSGKISFQTVGSWSPGPTLDPKYEHVGLIDSVGTEVIPQRFRGFSNYSDGLVITWRGRFVGVWDIVNRKEILPPEYTLIATNDENFFKPILFEGKYFIVENDNGQRGLFDRTGTQIIPFKYSSLKFKNGLILATKGDKSGVLDYDGNEVVPFKYDIVKISKNCIQVAQSQGDSFRWGILSRTGKEKHSCTIKYMEDESEGLIAASSNGDLWGYYNIDGDMVISEKFTNASDFSDGLAIVWYEGERGYINRKGEATFDNK